MLSKEERRLKKREESKKLHDWFITEIWNKRPHYSELSSDWLGKAPNKCFFHHIFPKETYSELKYESWNIIMITAQEHYEITNGKIPKKLTIIKEIKGKKYGISFIKNIN
jgi:hypothetical protein